MADKENFLPSPIGGNEIAIRCKTVDRLDWGKITPLQGGYKKRNKSDIDKIKKSILDYGFAFPMFVSRIGKEIYALDGHGRLIGLEALEKEGYAIPPIPVVYVEAGDINEAKQLLLRCDSRYGSVNLQGFMDFAKDIEFSVEDISIPEIDLSGFGSIDLDEETPTEKQEEIISCPKCGHVFNRAV
jgi:hypothetical protein